MSRAKGSVVRKENPVLGDRIEAALAILSGTPISFSYQDSDLRYVWFENAPDDWDVDGATGGTDADLFPAASAAEIVTAKRNVLESGSSRKYELALEQEGGTRYFDLYLQPDRDAAGMVVGVLSSIVDVTDRRRSEAIRHTLLREVTHRSKNLLAIVISLAAQTSRTARSTEDFLQRFNGRLQSMARSQDLVTETNWRGARLSELVATQVEPFAADGSKQVALTGSDVYLTPNAALYVGLGLHELAVNSVQRGALASPEGRLSLSTNRLAADDDPKAPALVLTWTETNGGGIEGPDPEEFGHVLLARLIPSAVGGVAEFQAGADGFRYRLTMARREFE